MKCIPLLLLMILLNVHYTSAQSFQWIAEANAAGLQTNGVAYSADGTKAVSGTNCHPANIRVYDTQNGALQWDYEVPTSLYCIMGVGISSNGQYLAAIEEFGNLLVFDYSVSPPDSITTISTGSQYAFSMAFSPDSKRLAVGGSDGKLIICDMVNGTVLQTIPNAHLNWVTYVHYDPTGNYLISGGSDSRIRIWDTTGTMVHDLTDHTSYITKVAADSNGKLYSSSKDKTIKKWDIQTGTLEHSKKASVSVVHALDLSYQEDYLVTVSNNDSIGIFDSDDLSFMARFAQDTGGTGISVACSPVAKHILVGTKLGQVVSYSLDNFISVDELSRLENFSVYPNPFEASLNLQIPGSDVESIAIIDATGKEVHRQQLKSENIEIQLGQLHPGIYNMIMTDRKGRLVESQKIVKR